MFEIQNPWQQETLLSSHGNQSPFSSLADSRTCRLRELVILLRVQYFMILYMGKIELLSTVCLANKYPIKNPLRSVGRVLLLLDKILNCYESVCHQIYLLYVEWKPNLKKVNTQVSSDVSSNSGFWLCLAGRTLIIFSKNGKSRPSIRIKYKNKKVS